MDTFTWFRRDQDREQHVIDQQETGIASMLPDCEIQTQFPTSPHVIDVDAIDDDDDDDDDDVIESTASAFAQAKNKPTGSRNNLDKSKALTSQVEQKFNCPICLCPFTEEMSTKCGHIFCKNCIKIAISCQGKCPTCREAVTAKDLIRVFLPATR